MKVILSEIKKNLQETNSRGKETRIQINNLEHKGEIKIQPEQKEETTIQKKNEDRLRNPWDISKYANILIIVMPEGEEKEQEIENLLQKRMKENFLNLVKELDIQVQEAQRVLNKLGPKRTTPRHNQNAKRYR